MNKTFVIADIHGFSKTLKTLIETQLKPSKEDKIYFSGDYIDRGPDSKGVLDYIIDLKNKGYNIFPLRGNHEQDLIEKISAEYRSLKLWLKIGGMQNLLEGNEIADKYKEFILSLPYYYELENHFIVHAGFDTSQKYPFKNEKEMLRIRGFEYESEIFKGKKVIIGHTPQKRQNIISSVKNKESIICIDNGIYYVKKLQNKSYDDYGHLCALELNSMQLFFQKDCD